MLKRLLFLSFLIFWASRQQAQSQEASLPHFSIMGFPQKSSKPKKQATHTYHLQGIIYNESAPDEWKLWINNVMYTRKSLPARFRVIKISHESVTLMEFGRGPFNLSPGDSFSPFDENSSSDTL